jgi:hypothetical protein
MPSILTTLIEALMVVFWPITLGFFLVSRMTHSAPPAPHENPSVDRGPPHWLLPPILAAMSIIFLLDLSLSGVNLGVLYVVPLTFAFKARIRTAWLVFLAVLAVFLILFDEVMSRGFGAPRIAAPPSGLLNKSFDVLAVGVTTALMIAFRSWQNTRSLPRPHRKSATQSVNLPSLPWRSSWAVAWICVVIFFALDIVTPDTANLPILYLAPLALIATACPAASLWRVCLVLLALLVAGYYASALYGMRPEIARLIAIDRSLAAASIIAFALFVRSQKLESIGNP